LAEWQDWEIVFLQKVRFTAAFGRLSFPRVTRARQLWKNCGNQTCTDEFAGAA
jgi:hypothetical protein